MAKGLRLGKADSTVLKMKKGYFGDTASIPHKIKKMFIGNANSVPVLFFSGSGGNTLAYEKIERVLTFVSGYKGTDRLRSVSNDNYALFKVGVQSSTVYALDTNFTYINAPDADYAGGNQFAATSSYLFITGGFATFPSSDKDDKYYSTIHAYDSSLTKNSSLNLSYKTYRGCGGTVGNTVLIAGGSHGSTSGSTTVDVITNTLTRSTATALSYGRFNLKCANVGSYIIFAGGGSSKNNSHNATDAYNSSLTKISTISKLTNTKFSHEGCNNNSYALFGGGFSSSGYCKVTYAYDKNLTLTTATQFDINTQYHSSVSTEEIAIFSGGTESGTTQHKLIYLYDTNLTKKVDNLPNGKAYHTSVYFNDYVLIAGGQSSDYYSWDDDGSTTYPQDPRVIFYTLE